jgi:type I restriction enzyme M protein
MLLLAFYSFWHFSANRGNFVLICIIGRALFFRILQLAIDVKELIKKLGYTPKENSIGVYQKCYSQANGYCLEIDFESKSFNYGKLITAESKTTQNFSQKENWVVLECVNRLLEKGYKPKDIILEKTFPSGHGHSGRLDILVKKEKNAFLMIECKTYGKEYDKELTSINKKGGQLFTYFQNDTKADFLMLYTSSLINKDVVYKNEIIKIEDNYRTAGNVEDVFSRWNKIYVQNGIFEDWIEAYHFQNKRLIKKELKPLHESDSGFIFHGFLSILRKHSVSDKPNAFNKIFNLFLAKLYDEKKKPNDELDFQWRENVDTPVDFQIRLIILYQDGMLAFLKKEVVGITDEDFKNFAPEEILAQKKKWLKFNNVFAIKEVIDDESFDDNQKVLKEVVELLHKYQIRYPRRQQHLSDFFERLLTTGLKQEVGQFFTPPPITKFIIKSLPVETEIKKTLSKPVAELPAVIDYAVGSGHFITEMLEEYQNIINNYDASDCYPEVEIKVKTWQNDQYSWASRYIYGVDKDYRLVKVAKVGCYFYGDGLAQIIHGDGLDNFKDSRSFRGLLKQKTNSSDNAKFSFVISNPPYSVSAFKADLRNKSADKDFTLYQYLTDKSSEIECLFVERTKQLLKCGGMAGIIMPSSILSNAGIYTKTREILLQHFDIIAIAELGSNTFMATGTNTVVLFLKRRKKSFAKEVKEKVSRAFADYKDVTINGIEKPISKYVTHTWGSISINDYVTLLKKQPNKNIEKHDIYLEYQKKIKIKNSIEKWNKILKLEEEKLFYFILSYSQKVILVKTGQKKEEKQFLGYEFSNRRGSEGIHPIQRGKSIDECTSLFDADTHDNPLKASTYVYKAFNGDVSFSIHESLKQNVCRIDLVNMLMFDQVNFEKSISLSAKKMIIIESKWELVRLGSISQVLGGGTPDTKNEEYWDGDFNWATLVDTKRKYLYSTERKITTRGIESSSATLLPVNSVIFSSRATIGDVCISKVKTCTNQGYQSFVCDASKVHFEYLYHILKCYALNIASLASGMTYPEISKSLISDFKIPLPPKNIQKKIVAEIDLLEKQEQQIVEKLEKLKDKIYDFYFDKRGKKKRLDEICEMNAGKFVKAADIIKNYTTNLFPCYGGNGLRGYTKTFTNEGLFSLVGRQGALCGNVHLVSGKFHATEHALVVYPKNNVSSIWLHHQLVLMNLNQYATGAAQPGLSVKNLKPIPITVPSLLEQKKIVSEIKKLESKITILQATIKDIPQQKEVILKKYL